MSYDAAPRASTSSASSTSSTSSHGRRSPVSWGLPTTFPSEEKSSSRRRITKQPRSTVTSSSPLHFLYPGLQSTHTSTASTPTHTQSPLPSRYGQPTSYTTSTSSTSAARRAARNEAKLAAAAARRSNDLARMLDPAYLPAAARKQLESAHYAGQQAVYVDDDGEMHDPDWKHFPVLPLGMGVNSDSRQGRVGGGVGMVKDGRQSSTGSGSGYARSGAYGSSLSAARRGASPTSRGSRPGQRRPPFDWELAVDEEALADEYPEDAVRAEELSTRLREEQRAKERREKEAREREERRRSLGDAPGSPGGRREDKDRGYGGSGRRSWEDPGPMRVPSPMNDVLLLGPAQPKRTTPVSAPPKAPVPNTIAYQQPGVGRHTITKVTSSRGVSRGSTTTPMTRPRDGSFSTFGTATTAPTSWESAAPVRETDAPVVGGMYVLGGARDAEKEAAEKEQKVAVVEKECVTTRIAKKARRFSWGSSKKDVSSEKASPASPTTPLSPTSPTSQYSSGFSYSYSPSPYIDEADEHEARDEDEEEEHRAPQTAYAPSCGQSLRRQWHAFALSVRFGVFRAQRRVMRRVHSIL